MNNEPAQMNSGDLSVQRLIEAVTGLAVFMLDVDGNVASWTSGAQAIKGYTADEVIGRHFSLFFTEEDRRTGKPAEALDQRADKWPYRMARLAGQERSKPLFRPGGYGLDQGRNRRSGGIRQSYA